jgi:Thiol:disulfide interchange protein DsbD, N-terminal
LIATRIRCLLCLGALLLLPLTSGAQDGFTRKKPSVTMAPPPLTTVVRGTTGSIQLRFRIGSGFHINSSKPKSSYLIPTTLRLDAPTDIVLSDLTYPAGQDASFPFAPDEKINVYSGEFAVGVSIHPLAKVLPGTYAVHGVLKYQACDNAACYPPKKLPVAFDVKVAKATKPRLKAKNPAQSPHIHQ